MDALNQKERNTSLINFVAIYVIIIALPLFLAFWMGTKKPSKGGNQKAVVEQEALAKDMDAMQQYIAIIAQENDGRPKDTDVDETWRGWLLKAEQNNDVFSRKVNAFSGKPGYTGARDRIRKNACAYLQQLAQERGNYLSKRKTLLGVQNNTAAIKELQNENERLKSENKGLDNTLKTTQMMMAQANKASTAAAAAGGAGGGGQPNPEIENLKWQLKFSDANCKKTQADILETYNDTDKRKVLYTVARQNFQIITKNARNSFTIQQLASDKIQEIDRQLSRL